MGRIFKPFLSGLMAFLVLASTVSWTVDKHVCMGRVLDISLFAHAQDCGMDPGMEIDCCDDESFTVQGQDDLKQSFDTHQLDPQVFSPAPLPSQFFTYVWEMDGNTAFRDYSPPPLLRDVQVLHQTFLI